MTRIPFIRFCAILIAALFLFAQGMTQAHDAEHGVDHDHDGLPCAVSIIGEDQSVLPVPKETQSPETEARPFQDFEPVKTFEFDSNHPSRAPPPRAPPL